MSSANSLYRNCLTLKFMHTRVMLNSFWLNNKILFFLGQAENFSIPFVCHHLGSLMMKKIILHSKSTATLLSTQIKHYTVIIDLPLYNVEARNRWFVSQHNLDKYRYDKIIYSFTSLYNQTCISFSHSSCHVVYW